MLKAAGIRTPVNAKPVKPTVRISQPIQPGMSAQSAIAANRTAADVLVVGTGLATLKDADLQLHCSEDRPGHMEINAAEPAICRLCRLGLTRPTTPFRLSYARRRRPASVCW